MNDQPDAPARELARQIVQKFTEVPLKFFHSQKYGYSTETSIEYPIEEWEQIVVSCLLPLMEQKMSPEHICKLHSVNFCEVCCMHEAFSSKHQSRVETLTAGVVGQDLARRENGAAVTDDTRTDQEDDDDNIDAAIQQIQASTPEPAKQKLPSLPEALYVLRKEGYLGLRVADALLVIYRALPGPPPQP